MSIVTEIQHTDSDKSYWVEKCMEANSQQQIVNDFANAKTMFINEWTVTSESNCAI